MHDGAAGASTRLRKQVRDAYSAAAEHPDKKHAFPVGRAFAASVGYPPDLLAQLPAAAVEAFAGVSNVSILAELPMGSIVLDLGCGAGLDSLIAARRVGRTGHVCGVDFSEAMLARARVAAAEAEAPNVTFERADAEQLPFPAQAFDVALVNGIFNLNPCREQIFRELFRVLRPGGSVFAAELILTERLPVDERASAFNWFAWVAGAREGVPFLDEFRAAGFAEARLIRTMRNARTKNPRVLAAEVVAVRHECRERQSPVHYLL